MLKQHWRIFNHLERIGDNLVIIAAFYFTYFCRSEVLYGEGRWLGALPKPAGDLGPISDYFIVLVVGVPLFNAILSILGAYRSMRFLSITHLLKVTVFAALLVFLCEGAVLYALKLDLSRSFVGIFCASCFIAICIERWLVLIVLRYFRIRGKNFRNILIVGTGNQARKIYKEIVRRPEVGIRVRGFVQVAHEAEEEYIVANDSQAACGQKSEVFDLPARVVANAHTFERALKKHAIDEVLFTDVVDYFNSLKDLAEIAVEEGVQVSLAADVFSLEIFSSDISYFGNFPLIHYEPSPAEEIPFLIKRLLDIVIATSALVILSPVMIITAICIKLDSAGPIFFKQRRVGLNGRIFTLLKFRSMVKRAHSMLSQLRQYNEMSGPAFKMSNDPRVTKVGRFIRRYSIDELPQFINVFKGDMSLVGPRPPLPSEVSQYRRKQRRRLSMRPGLTCTWQVSGRNKIVDFDQWAKMDLDYIDNWSLGKDLVLLIKTVPAVLSGFGAK